MTFTSMKLKSLLKLTSMVLIAAMLCGTTACQLTQQYLKQRYPTLYSTNGVPSGENATTQQPVKLLNDYPTTCAGITFTTTKTPDEYPWYETITVTKRGHEPQTFDIEGFQCSDDQPLVHFVDANFDGHTDLYLGTGEDRTFNNILIWNQYDGRFVQAFPKTGNHLPRPIFCPRDKRILSYASGGAWLGAINEFVPQGNSIVNNGHLEINYDRNDNASYVIRRGGEEGPIIARASHKSALPEHWQTILTIVNNMNKLYNDYYQ